MLDDREPALELHAEWLRVPLGAGEHADFHYRWLRHNCERERHPQTHERTLCSSELPDDLRPISAAMHDDALEIVWPPDHHTSVYPRTWLRANAYALGRVATPPPTPTSRASSCSPAAATSPRRCARPCTAWSCTAPPSSATTLTTPRRPRPPPSP